MAKPRPVPGVKPRKRLRRNARRVLAVRIDEVYAREEAVLDPANVADLHDMRIACKRLRYLLEIFAVAFSSDLEPFIDEVRGLQDLLGEIHDRDVQVPMLEDHLAALDGRPSRAGERIGVQSLIARQRAERQRLHARFLGEWRRLGTERYRARLEAALGISPGG